MRHLKDIQIIEVEVYDSAKEAVLALKNEPDGVWYRFTLSCSRYKESFGII